MTRALAPEIALQIAVNAELLSPVGDGATRAGLARVCGEIEAAELSGAHLALDTAARAWLDAPARDTHHRLQLALAASVRASAQSQAAETQAAAAPRAGDEAPPRAGDDKGRADYPWQRRADLA